MQGLYHNIQYCLPTARSLHVEMLRMGSSSDALAPLSILFTLNSLQYWER